MSLPLEGYRVLSFAHAWAVPYGAMMLADMGADVVKVEVPGVGDHTRLWTRNDLRGISPHFVSVNRNKRSIQIDLTTEAGREVARRLVLESDAIMENFAPGKLAKYGFDYAGAAKIKPDIVYCSVSGYGASGPYVSRRAYDLLLQAESGIVSVTGSLDGDYAKVGVAIADVAAAMVAAYSTVCALLDHTRTGRGANIDMSMLEVATSLMAFNVVDYSVSGKIPGPLGTAHPLLAPYQCYATATEPVVVCILTDRHWEIFRGLVQRSELDDARFATAPMRVEYRDELNKILAEVFLEHPQDWWVERLNELGLACGSQRNVAGVLAHPQHEARDFFEHYTLDGVDVTVPGKPWAYGEARARPSAPPAVSPGMHGADVLADWLGLSDAEIDELAGAGAVTVRTTDPAAVAEVGGLDSAAPTEQYND